MLRTLLSVMIVLAAATGTSHAGDNVIEPYGPTPTAPVPPPIVAPVAPVIVVPAPPPPPNEYPQYPQQQYPQQQYPQQQYYAPPNYYQQPGYAPTAPAHYRVIEQPRYGLMTAGLVIFGVSWSVNALSGYLADEWRVAVPVVGPLLYAHNIDNGSDLGTRTAIAGLVFDALIEATGVAMFLAGVLTHHDVRILERAKVLVVPTTGFASATGASAGLAAVGRF